MRKDQQTQQELQQYETHYNQWGEAIEEGHPDHPHADLAAHEGVLGVLSGMDAVTAQALGLTTQWPRSVLALPMATPDPRAAGTYYYCTCPHEHYYWDNHSNNHYPSSPNDRGARLIRSGDAFVLGWQEYEHGDVIWYFHSTSELQKIQDDHAQRYPQHAHQMKIESTTVEPEPTKPQPTAAELAAKAAKKFARDNERKRLQDTSDALDALFKNDPDLIKQPKKPGGARNVSFKPN